MTRIAQSADAAPQPRFDVDVPSSGYRWWYVDGLSDDGRSGIVVIAFIGSVFSPYYFRARAQGDADPGDFCSINVGLYRPRGKLWAMTERGSGAVERGTDWFRVGPSALSWRNDQLDIDIRERSMPAGRPMRGRITLHPAYLSERNFELDAQGRHAWRPVAPAARIVVDFDKPALSWQGHGYMDSNGGARALENDFARWNWSRSNSGENATISYAVTTRCGNERALALCFRENGECREVRAPAAVDLPRSRWRVARPTRIETAPTLVRTLEDTPFYARSLLSAADGQGASRLVMHEALDLERFAARWVQLLLPFRMPRVNRARPHRTSAFRDSR